MPGPVTVSGIPTALPNSLMERDGDANTAINNIHRGFLTQSTAATLTVASAWMQVLTGSTARTHVLPVVSTLVTGFEFLFVNDSSAIWTINSSGGNLVISIPPNWRTFVRCVLTSGTSAASWSFQISPTQGYVDAGDAAAIATAEAYADSLQQQFELKDPVVCATTGALPFSPTYANGSSGVGATLTGSVGILIIDGHTWLLNERGLVKNQGSTFQNGIYKLTTVGTALIGYVLTREPDFNQTSNILYGDTVGVLQGTVNANQQFTMNNNNTIVVGTTAITFAQTSGGSQLVEGPGIQIVGNTVSVDPEYVRGFYAEHDTVGITLDIDSPKTHRIFGTSGSSFVLPDVTTLFLGWDVLFLDDHIDASVTTVLASDNSSTVAMLSSGDRALITCNALTGTNESSWSVTFIKVPPYLVYVARISQSGSDDPGVSVLQNTIGNLVWTRVDIGTYDITLADAFIGAGLGAAIFTSPDPAGKSGPHFLQYDLSSSTTDSLRFLSFDITGVLADAQMNGDTVEIRLYPV